MYEHERARPGVPGSTQDDGTAGTPGKRTLVEGLGVIQRKLADGAAGSAVSAQPAEAAAHGTSGPSTQLPHLDQIQRLFGRHDVSGVAAHQDSAAHQGAGALGAKAFAVGNHVAFAEAPTLHTAAHEAAHVVQQRGGVQRKAVVGDAGDAYEAHADAVADAVVAGRSAEALLDDKAGGAPAVIRRAIGAGKHGAKVIRAGDPKTIYTAQLQVDGVNYRIVSGEGAEVDKDVAPDDARYDLAPSTAAAATPSATPPSPVASASASAAAGAAASASAPAKSDDGKAGGGHGKLVEAAAMVSAAPRVDAAMVKAIGEDTLEGAMLASEQILARWPADGHVYIGVGRSPALITAYLDARGCTTCTVPLSSFKHGAVTMFGHNEPLTEEQEARLASHFSQYLIAPAALAGRDIVVIDFVMMGPGAIASYNYIHRYYVGPMLKRPDRDAFFDNGDLCARWGFEYDESNFASLEIRLAILCARSNRGEIQKIIDRNVADNTQWPGLGDVSRLLDDDHLLVTPQDAREDVLMGKLDAEALKNYSKHGKQDAPSKVTRESYRALVELFRAYHPRTPIRAAAGAPGGSSGSAAAAAAPNPHAEHKQKSPEPEALFAMLQAGVGLDLLAFEHDEKRRGPAQSDAKAAPPGANAAAVAVAAAPAPAPAAAKLPVEAIAKLTSVIEKAIPIVNGDLLTQDSTKVQPIKAALVALVAGLGAATTLEQLIACLTGVKASLEALGKALPVKAASRGIADDVATRAETLLANAVRRHQRS